MQSQIDRNGRITKRHNNSGFCCVCVDLYLVGVPQSDRAAKWQLPHQEVVHPAEGKLQVLHLILLHMAVHRLCWKIIIITFEKLEGRSQNTDFSRGPVVHFSAVWYANVHTQPLYIFLMMCALASPQQHRNSVVTILHHFLCEVWATTCVMWGWLIHETADSAMESSYFYNRLCFFTTEDVYIPRCVAFFPLRQNAQCLILYNLCDIRLYVILGRGYCRIVTWHKGCIPVKWCHCLNLPDCFTFLNDCLYPLSHYYSHYWWLFIKHQ